jgi:cell division protein FtsB
MKRLIAIFVAVLLISAGAYAQSSASTQDNDELRKELDQLKKTMTALEERLAATEQKTAQPARSSLGKNQPMLKTSRPP